MKLEAQHKKQLLFTQACIYTKEDADREQF